MQGLDNFRSKNVNHDVFIVKNNIPVVDVYSGPYAHYHGSCTIKEFDPDTPMSDVKSDVSTMITAMVEKDTGFIGKQVSFRPCDDATLLGKVETSYVHIGQQPTIMSNPILSAEVKHLKEEVRTLQDELKHHEERVSHLLKRHEDRVTDLLRVAAPTTYRQLIEKKRERLWVTYGSDFTKRAPSGTTKDSYYSRSHQRTITKSRPTHWSQFLDFVQNELTQVPSFWEVLHGGNNSDYSHFSEDIHSLPEKEAYLKIVHPTGVYADLFADIYGVTVEQCLAAGEGNKYIAAEGTHAPSTKSGGELADDCMPQNKTS